MDKIANNKSSFDPTDGCALAIFRCLFLRKLDYIIVGKRKVASDKTTRDAKKQTKVGTVERCAASGRAQNRERARGNVDEKPRYPVAEVLRKGGWREARDPFTDFVGIGRTDFRRRMLMNLGRARTHGLECL